MKEERPIVGRRRDVERIVRVERLAVRGANQSAVVVTRVALSGASRLPADRGS